MALIVGQPWLGSDDDAIHSAEAAERSPAISRASVSGETQATPQFDDLTYFPKFIVGIST